MGGDEERDNILSFPHPGMDERIPAEKWMGMSGPYKTIGEISAEYAHQVTHKIIGTSKVFATIEEMIILEDEVTKMTTDFILNVIGMGPQD
jgi:hypothetical protein